MNFKYYYLVLFLATVIFGFSSLSGSGYAFIGFLLSLGITFLSYGLISWKNKKVVKIYALKRPRFLDGTGRHFVYGNNAKYHSIMFIILGLLFTVLGLLSITASTP